MLYVIIFMLIILLSKDSRSDSEGEEYWTGPVGLSPSKELDIKIRMRMRKLREKQKEEAEKKRKRQEFRRRLFNL